MLTVLLAAIAVVSVGFQPREGPKRLDPAASLAEAKPHAVYSWTSGVALLDEDGKPTADKLRYTFVLPEKLAKEPPHDLIVMCHGTGLDYRWGSANHPAARFRPNDIVVAVDGPTKAQSDTRLFLGREQDAKQFAAFLLEMKRTFPVRRVYLYGHSQGSFFVGYFAGLNSDMIDGVVAHASGLWNWSDFEAIAEAGLPIVFMHGSADPVVPYGQSVGARTALLKLTPPHPCVGLRRVDGYNHWPNAVRTGECIDWLKGLTAGDAAEAIAAAESLAATKPPDEYEYTCAPAYGLALDVVRRVQGKGPKAMKDVKPELIERAATLEAKIESAGAAQVAALRGDEATGVRAPDDLKLRPDCAWLGHILAVREDFRGVESVENYLSAIKFDEAAARHTKAARPLFDAWYSDQKPAAIFAASVEALPKCFLCDTLPAGLGEKLTEWYNTADTLKIDEKSLVKGTVVKTYVDAVRRGNEAYQKSLAEGQPASR